MVWPLYIASAITLLSQTLPTKKDEKVIAPSSGSLFYSGICKFSLNLMGFSFMGKTPNAGSLLLVRSSDWTESGLSHRSRIPAATYLGLLEASVETTSF